MGPPPLNASQAASQISANNAAMAKPAYSNGMRASMPMGNALTPSLSAMRFATMTAATVSAARTDISVTARLT